jgi:hypothetical protein
MFEAALAKDAAKSEDAKLEKVDVTSAFSTMMSVKDEDEIVRGNATTLF